MVLQPSAGATTQVEQPDPLAADQFQKDCLEVFLGEETSRKGGEKIVVSPGNLAGVVVHLMNPSKRKEG